MSAQEEGAKEQDKYLPIANIARIMKKALPPNAKVAKDAKETVQECVSEFISFITSEVSDGGKGGRDNGEPICLPSFGQVFFVSFPVRPLLLLLLRLLLLLLLLLLLPPRNPPETPLPLPWSSQTPDQNKQTNPIFNVRNLHQASDKCQREKRKTINGDDLLWALSTLGFECYVDPLKAYLAKYRESEKNAMAAGGGGKGGEEGAGPSADGGETD